MAGLVPRPHRPRLAAPHRRFGDYVREVRISKRMTLRACAQAIGLAAGHLSNIEHASVTPPEEPTILRMATVLEIPAGALLARSGRLGIRRPPTLLGKSADSFPGDEFHRMDPG